VILSNYSGAQNEKTTNIPQIDSSTEVKSTDNISKLLTTFLIFEFAIIMYLLFRSRRFKAESEALKNESNKQIKSQIDSLENLEN
jgi:hypothetical protein